MIGFSPSIINSYTAVSGSNPGPVDGVLVLLDVLLHHATLIVEGCSHIGDALILGALGDSDLAFAPQAGMNAPNRHG